MRFYPLGDEFRREPSRPIGLVAAGVGELTIWTQWGPEIGRGESECRAMLERYSGHVLYAMSSFHSIRETTGHAGWILFRWSRVIAWQELEGARIIPTRGVFVGLHPSDALAALLRVARSAGEHRVRMGSWSSMARQLWRSTLDEPIAFAGRELDRVGMFGGRKDCADWIRGIILEDVTHVDLKGAYPSAMFREPYPTRMVRSRRPHLDGESIVRAIVTMPPQPWAVVPERLRSDVLDWRAGRTVEGWWTARELRSARESGATVRPRETWTGTRSRDAFERWGSVIVGLRERPGVEGTWWKIVSNSLWGTFALRNDIGGEFVTLAADGLPDRIEPSRRRQPPATANYVATLTTARVRDQVLREALGLGWNSSAVYVDTDGVMILRGGRLPESATDHPIPGEWKVDRTMPRVMVQGPQAWAWWDEDDVPHVSISGVTDATLDHLRRIPVNAATIVGAVRR